MLIDLQHEMMFSALFQLLIFTELQQETCRHPSYNLLRRYNLLLRFQSF
ncbi:hypothetical protein HMPREF0971_02952 [Segatella oris F0302]|uniref:Uncharacterized protein n=1 Tax=Segatella oris F0302 TaxID=649760 RepID=D1QVH4_9BACT|nr:hypothetical protein HMPREF0971_02952 [Segatella oris F0302]